MAEERTATGGRPSWAYAFSITVAISAGIGLAANRAAISVEAAVAVAGWSGTTSARIRRIGSRSP